MDVQGGAPIYNEKNIEVYTDNNGPAQRWAFFANGDGSYRLMPKVGNQAMCISVNGGSMDSPANLHLWDYTKASEQGWYLEKAENIATLSLYSLPSNGHSWITIKNKIGATIKAGFYSITSGEEISIGTFGNQTDHCGVWYNIESYYADAQEYLGRVSLSEDIGINELNEITNYIKNNDTWSLYFNCSRFSATIWNNVTDKDIDINFISTPAAVASAIKQKSGYQTNRNFQKHTKDEIGYKSNSSDALMKITAAIINSLSG